MEKNQSPVPPGIAPKLPDPPPIQPKKALTRRETFILAAAGVVALALVVCLIIFALSSGRSAADAVNRDAGSLFAVQEEIVQVGLPGAGQRSVLFYISGDQLACALLQRGATGYSLINASGHLPLTSTQKPGIWMASGLPSDKKEFFVFGLLYDAALKSVEVDGNAATIVDTGTYRCWFYYGESVTSINSESVVYK